MSETKRQRSGADQRGDGAGRDAGMHARGRATQGAVADKDDARAAKVRRSAWLLAGFAVFVYVAYMVWFVIGGSG